MTKKKIVEFKTVTDYQQTFEICLNDIWQHYISEQEKAFPDCPFDDEEKDINEYDDDQLCDIAWEYILKNPRDYRTCEPDYDNENIMEQSITEED